MTEDQESLFKIQIYLLQFSIEMQSPGDVWHIEEGTDGEVVATRGENIRENWSHVFVVFCHLVGQSIVFNLSKQTGLKDYVRSIPGDLEGRAGKSGVCVEVGDGILVVLKITFPCPRAGQKFLQISQRTNDGPTRGRVTCPGRNL